MGARSDTEPFGSSPALLDGAVGDPARDLGGDSSASSPFNDIITSNYQPSAFPIADVADPTFRARCSNRKVQERTITYREVVSTCHGRSRSGEDRPLLAAIARPIHHRV